MKYLKNIHGWKIHYQWRRKLFVLFLGLLLLHTLSAQNIVYVGGTLKHDRVWSSDSVYIVVQDLRIPDSVMLLINPGTTVKVVQSRGIYVQGTLRVGSNDSVTVDSVRFIANSQKGLGAWRWKGIVFKNSLPEDTNFIINTSVKDAEIAVELIGCENVVIKNCKLEGSQQAAVNIIDSRNCSVTHCDLMNNYDGIELDATLLHRTTGISISKNYLSNENHNILMYREDGAVMNNNTIALNIIQNGNNGIWFDNAGEDGSEHNMITHNIFIANGGDVGYALFIANDSTEVQNNIFWNNNIAVYIEQNVKYGLLINNSFYQNEKGIVINRMTTGIRLIHNTFAAQKLVDADFSETINNTFSQNNLFPNKDAENLIINETNEDFIIAGNFWNTASDSVINTLIWDKEDNPSLGKFFYHPFLTNADTTNPVSPPLLVKKQWIDGKTLLSWPANKEKDVIGYKVYWGNFNRYGFSNSMDVGLDTSFSLETIFSNTITVTAYDSAGKTENTQLSGHESPFSFSILYPFAGNDSVICKYQNSFKITDSNIPFSHRQIKWTTDGNGSFNNDTIIRPVYFPGTQDVQRGKVVLTIHVQNEKKQWLEDNLTLSIFDDPVAYAGNDTLISNTDSLFLSEASASNFEHVFWQSSGNGFFINDSLINPVYVLGQNDKQLGHVSLYFYVFSRCGFSIDSLQLTILPFWQLHGKLWMNNQSFANSVIIARKQGDTTFKSIEITNVQPDGSFLFNPLIEGSYFLYAIPDTNTGTDVLPTYYVNDARWQKAYLMPVYANTYDVDIRLNSAGFILPPGEGSISGHFAFPAFSNNFIPYFQSWFSENKEKISGLNGLPNATILLYNPEMSNIFRFALTNANGDFMFGNLPYGSYIVDVELTGYTSMPSPIITLSPSNKNVANVHLEINQKKVMVNFTHTHNSEYLTVYPNPVTDQLHFSVIPKENTLVILRILDTQGQVLFTKKIPTNKNSSSDITITGMERFPPGFYLGILTVGNRIFCFHFVKI